MRVDMNSSGVSKEVELHSFMRDFSASFALSMTKLILAVWSLKSSHWRVCSSYNSSREYLDITGPVVPQPSEKMHRCTSFIHRPSISTGEALVILLLLDAPSLLSLHVLEKVSWQFLGDFNSPEQREAAPLLVVSIKPDRERLPARLESRRGAARDGLVMKFASEKEWKEDIVAVFRL